MRVKALVWNDTRVGIHYANAWFVVDGLQYELSPAGTDKWWMQLLLADGREAECVLCDTLEAAKLAAQADYERRVMACLSADSATASSPPSASDG